MWLIISIFAYFLFSLVALIDKYLLIGPPNPKGYSFYVAILGILALILIPFVGFSLPDPFQIFLSLLAGAFFIFALFSFYSALEVFEASRVVPTIGGLLPLFTFGLIVLFPVEKETLSFLDLLAFFLLVSGSILISLENKEVFSFANLKISAITAFLFSLSFLLTKFVYLAQPFWSGFILMRIGGFLAGLCFIFTPEVKREIFEKKFTFQKKSGLLFLFNQVLGAGAFLLQNWAVALVPLGFLAFLNALEGIKYLFLLFLTIFLSLKFPQVLKEEISKRIIFQKIVAILLIIGGLVLLSF